MIFVYKNDIFTFIKKHTSIISTTNLFMQKKSTFLYLQVAGIIKAESLNDNNSKCKFNVNLISHVYLIQE